MCYASFRSVKFIINPCTPIYGQLLPVFSLNTISFLLNIGWHITGFITFTDRKQQTLPREPQVGSKLIQRQSYFLCWILCFWSKEALSESILYLLFCLEPSLYSVSAQKCSTNCISQYKHAS